MVGHGGREGLGQEEELQREQRRRHGPRVEEDGRDVTGGRRDEESVHQAREEQDETLIPSRRRGDIDFRQFDGKCKNIVM